MSNFATLNIISLTPSCILQENEIILWTTGFVEMRLHIAHGLSFILQILHYDQYSSFSMPKVQSTIVANIPALKIDRSSWMLKKHWPTISKPKRCTTMSKYKQAFSVHFMSFFKPLRYFYTIISSHTDTHFKTSAISFV